jgi:hypothetical protein
MNSLRQLYSNISSKWLLVGLALLGAAIAGIAFSLGQLRVVEGIFLLLGLCVLVLLPQRFKLWLFALSIPLSLAQIPSLTITIPLHFSICEIILLILTMDEVLFIRNNKPLKLEIIIPLGIFAVLGLVCLQINKGWMVEWHTYYLMPLLWFFLASQKFHDRKEAWLFVKLAVLTIAGFAAIVVWANLTGHFESLNPGSTSYQWRLGEEQLIVLGPIRLSVWGIRLASIVALGFPACILLWLEDKNKSWWSTGALLMLVGFCCVLILSAGRGATLAAIVGTFLVILASGRFRSLKLWGTIALIFVVITLWGEAILKLFPAQNIPRLLTVLRGVQGDADLQIRTNALALIWKLTLQNPLGTGWGYLWYTYLIDDSTIYSYLLETSGILGSIAFLVVVAQLVYKFVLVISKSSRGFFRNFASIGLGTLVVGLLAGVSSQSIMYEPVHSFVFWGLLATTYYGLLLPVSPEGERKEGLL